jgi:hypothetical protein
VDDAEIDAVARDADLRLNRPAACGKRIGDRALERRFVVAGTARLGRQRDGTMRESSSCE